MSFLKHIFSIKDNIDKTRRTITFLGIKINIKIKPKRKRVSKNAKTNNFGIIPNNEEVVILANGPSLYDSLLDENTKQFIKSKNIMCVNSFPQSDYFFELKPNFLFWIDSGFWCSNPNKELQESISKITLAIEKVDWDIYIILPQFAKECNKFTQISQENQHVKIVYINTRDSYWNNEARKFLEYKTNFSMPGPQNVLIACIYCAINVGYKNIYIFGADHSWISQLTVDNNNVVCMQDGHFYDEKNNIKIRPCYRTWDKTCTFTMREQLSIFAITFEKYELLERYSKFMGSKIYNMSKVSYIDAFERKKLGEKEYVEQ